MVCAYTKRTGCWADPQRWCVCLSGFYMKWYAWLLVACTFFVYEPRFLYLSSEIQKIGRSVEMRNVNDALLPLFFCFIAVLRVQIPLLFGRSLGALLPREH